MTYGWHTTKTATGYGWKVVKVEYQKPVVVVREGVTTTRAKATLRAKRAVMPFRRSLAK